jgi:15-cis-phytoene synthase
VTSALSISARARPAMLGNAAELCARTLALHSKSFALAGQLLPKDQRRDAAVLYTYCRLADDAIDLVEPAAQPAALAELNNALDSVYRGEAQEDLRLSAFQELAQRAGLPREYPEELLAGMAMDTLGTQYRTLDELLLYCHRVAGVVGLMMCHVLGLCDARARKNAAHLGIAMQLTNICRDVAEDWQRGRLYLPAELFSEGGSQALGGLRPGFDGLPLGVLPRAAHASLASATQRLLAEAERFYRSADAGLRFLPVRAAFAIRAARFIYSAIGQQLLRSDYDLYATRAVVPKSQKLFLILKALLYTAADLPRRWFGSLPQASLESIVRYPDDILPL